MMSEGQLKIPSHMTVLHVEQEVVGDDTRSGLLGLSLLIRIWQIRVYLSSWIWI
jgi:hypothetical protein